MFKDKDRNEVVWNIFAQIFILTKEIQGRL